MKTVRLILAIHNHQPVGNFHHVFQKACAKAYHPFLDVFDEFPDIRMVLHFSGPLLEWIHENDVRLADRVKQGVDSRRFELLGGGVGEPILTMLSDADAAGQIQSLRKLIEDRYWTTPRGVWLTERVWESCLAGLLAGAGVDYTVVDDFHFLATGLREKDLSGYYTVEDRGRVLKVFSGSEFLRYAIPFRDPRDTIDYLRQFATEEGENVIVYADDGEKFGLWPKTYAHVYESGWLRRFAQALQENADWIRFTTFSDTVDELPPKGRVYLPDASYREMTEWAQFVPAQLEFARIRDNLGQPDLLKQLQPWLRGSTWRNFKVKYTEAAEMYARMMAASAFIAERGAAKRHAEARRALYRGQCNCAYWHGVFAGLYMPFLRSAIYENLLKAEALVMPKGAHPSRRVADHDFDGLDEVRLHNAAMTAYVKPDRGGSLYEWDHHAKAINLTAVMTRREEAYHARLVKAAQAAADAPENGGDAVSIHDGVRWKEPGLEKLLHYDDVPRDSLIDRFYPVGTSPDAIRTRQAPDWGDFAGKPYQLHKPHGQLGVVKLERTALVGPPDAKRPVTLLKRVKLHTKGRMEIRYVLQFPEGAPEGVVFAVENNLALSAADAPDRNFFSHEGENLNNLTTTLSRECAPRLGMVDEWLGLELWLHADPPAGFWTHPVETVNDSEEGFERIHQGSAVLPYWTLKAQPGEEMVLTLTLEARER